MKKNWKTQVSILSIGHGITDIYGSVYSPLLPALVRKLALSNADVGLLATVLSTGTSLVQVLFGYLADRLGKPIWMVVGPTVAAVFICSLGFAPSFPVLLAFLFLGGCGIAAYHPQAAAAAGRVHARYKGRVMSIFAVGGAVGFASGPLLMGKLGLERTHWAVFPGLLLTLALYWMLFRRHTLVFPEPQRSCGALFRALLPNIAPITLLFLIAAFRACTSIAYVTFLPLFLEEQGVVSTGGWVSLFLYAGGIGTLLGGTLSDYMSRKNLLVISLIGAVPLLYLFPRCTGWMFAAFLFLGGFILSSSLPVNIILGQQLLPQSASMASSFMMGLTWGVGGLMQMPIGRFADLSGVSATIRWLPIIPLVATGFALLIAEDRVRTHVDTK
jgi:FSR family fosmidomycin resistance protein-like MFS transporter